MGDPEEKVSDEEHRVTVASKRRLHRFQMKRGHSIEEHMNSYTKLLTDLVNVDVKSDEEDKAVILLNFLPKEEYETFILTSINEKKFLNYNEVAAALVNYEVRRRTDCLLQEAQQ